MWFVITNFLRRISFIRCVIFSCRSNPTDIFHNLVTRKNTNKINSLNMLSVANYITYSQCIFNHMHDGNKHTFFRVLLQWLLFCRWIHMKKRHVCYSYLQRIILMHLWLVIMWASISKHINTFMFRFICLAGLYININVS